MMNTLKKSSKKGLALLLLCLFVLSMLPLPSFAENEVDENRDITVSVTYPVNDVEFRLYKIAELSADGLTATMTGDFADSTKYPVSFGEISSEEFYRVGNTLLGYIHVEQPAPLMTASVTEGKAYFEGDETVSLKPGVYLLDCDTAIEENNCYTPDVMVFCAPSKLERSSPMIYDVEITGKYSVTPVTEKDQLEITKVWVDDNTDIRPKSVTVDLLKDGVAVDTVTLSDDNKWTYCWNDLEGGHNWTVVERNVSEDYTVTIKSANRYQTVIENKYNVPPTPTPPPDVPQTGMLWWPVPMLILAGLILFVVGILKQRRE